MTKTSNHYYLTTAIPYVNGLPHLGHVLEWFQADAIAVYQRQLGKQVSFTAGTDENSLKNIQAAEKAGIPIQQWLDQYAQIFEKSYKSFGISLTHFRRGSDQKLHWPGVQHLWQKCHEAGALYKKTYTGLYCVGCETFYTPDELIDGKCPEHLTVPEQVSEENYFFKLSDYQQKIRELIATDQLHIVSEQFKNEMLGFIDQGLEDFSVSRSVQRARGIGVPIPGDETQVMYVWFDALTIYMTAIGFGYDQEEWQDFWPADVHVIGKGINRFHSIYWIGILLAAGLPVPKAISVHGYITSNGQKMSKSLGNVIDPTELVSRYTLESVRYYLLKCITTHSDGDFSETAFREMYTADLAHGIGNTCSRVATLAAGLSLPGGTAVTEFDDDYKQLMAHFEVSQAAGYALQKFSQIDSYLSEHKPWLITDTSQKTEIITTALKAVLDAATHLWPIMPNTATTIINTFTAPTINKITPLFPRLESIAAVGEAKNS